MAEYDVIVIGAGISGLSFAHYCARAGRKVLVIEKSAQAGGALDSRRFGDAQDFWLEMGAHTAYNSYANLLGILEDDGLIGRLKEREKAPFKLLIDNETKSIPSQLNKLALLPALPRMFFSKKQGETVESYYSKLAGRGNYEKVLGHVFDAVVSQPAAGFPADLLFKKRERRKDIMKKFTFAGGLQEITDTMAAEPGIDLRTGQTVTGIETSDGFVSVSVAGDNHVAKSLAIATPASVAAGLLRSAFPRVSEALGKIKVNKIESVGVAVGKDATALEKFATMIAINDIFFSAVSRDVVPDENYRGFTFHFRPDTADADAKLKRIGEVLKIDTEQLNNVYAKDNCLPSLVVGQEKLAAEIDTLTAGTPVYLTGNYFTGLAIEDCVSRSLLEFKRLDAAGQPGK